MRFKFGHTTTVMPTEVNSLLETIAFMEHRTIGSTTLLRAEKILKDVVVSLRTQLSMATT